MSKEYKITGEQLEQISHFTRMFVLNAERVAKLASSEKDEIVYGFTLGEIHTHLRECFMDMTELENEIEDQNRKK